MTLSPFLYVFVQHHSRTHKRTTIVVYSFLPLVCICSTRTLCLFCIITFDNNWCAHLCECSCKSMNIGRVLCISYCFNTGECSFANQPKNTVHQLNWVNSVSNCIAGKQQTATRTSTWLPRQLDSLQHTPSLLVEMARVTAHVVIGCSSTLWTQKQPRVQLQLIHAKLAQNDRRLVEEPTERDS